MAYTVIDKPSDYFNTKLYTGTGSSLANTGVGFQPDLTWIKGRSGATEHVLTDSVRGVTKELSSNDTGAEETVAQGLTAFGSDGFTVGTDGSYNTGSATYASWNWKAGTSVSGDTTGSGTLKTYTGSVNTTSGFSIINFVGNGTAGHTIPHHLGVAPKMVIVKNRTSGSTSWQTYHYNLDNGAGTNEIFLDGTNATNGSAGAWNNTAPSSTVITKGTGSYGNENNSNHIMYSFAEKKGYSKFSSYIGNGNADGTFVYTGFKPAFIIIKPSSKVETWTLLDNKRLGYNTDNNYVYPNENYAELTNDRLDIVSNGFKIRASTGEINTSGATMIYAAFAESPFTTSTGIPATAR